MEDNIIHLRRGLPKRTKAEPDPRFMLYMDRDEDVESEISLEEENTRVTRLKLITGESALDKVLAKRGIPS